MGINFDEKTIECDLFDRYGPLIGGHDLHVCLGYKTASSFNRACRLGLIDLKTFEITSRRGKFALTKDVADWLVRISLTKVGPDIPEQSQPEI